MIRSIALFAFALFASASITSAQSQCSDVHVVFARGSGEMQGFGICGSPLVSGITKELQGMSVSSYAVRYGASVTQLTAGSGATDMTNHVVEVAQRCPNTLFVLGGYSQGGSVVDISIGIKTMLGSGKSIPQELAPRIAAIVTFGNPLKLAGGGTIAKASQLYGPKAIEFCDNGDPVCAGGVNVMGHVTYPVDGSVTKGAKRAAELVRQARGSSQSMNNNNNNFNQNSNNNGGNGNGNGNFNNNNNNQNNNGGASGFPSFSSLGGNSGIGNVNGNNNLNNHGNGNNGNNFQNNNNNNFNQNNNNNNGGGNGNGGGNNNNGNSFQNNNGNNNGNSFQNNGGSNNNNNNGNNNFNSGNENRDSGGNSNINNGNSNGAGGNGNGFPSLGSLNSLFSGGNSGSGGSKTGGLSSFLPNFGFGNLRGSN